MFDKIERVDLRTQWGHEATDFTPWLASAEGLSALSEALGLNLTDPSTETDEGKFRGDIVCNVDGDEDRRVVIENQLDLSDHSHLGQLVTYAGAEDAEVAVWVAPEFEKEHLNAIGWLNGISEGEPRYFAIEFSLIKIGNSRPAPHLVVLVRPADWKRRGPREDKPWLRDGKAWHLGPDISYPANVPTLEALTEALKGTEGVRVVWNQKHYVRLLGQHGRELRVWAGMKQDGLDVSFMHVDPAVAKGAMSAVQNAPTVREKYTFGKGPWIRLSGPSEITPELCKGLGAWLTAK